MNVYAVNKHRQTFNDVLLTIIRARQVSVWSMNNKRYNE